MIKRKKFAIIASAISMVAFFSGCEASSEPVGQIKAEEGITKLNGKKYDVALILDKPTQTTGIPVMVFADEITIRVLSALGKSTDSEKFAKAIYALSKDLLALSQINPGLMIKVNQIIINEEAVSAILKDKTIINASKELTLTIKYIDNECKVVINNKVTSNKFKWPDRGSVKICT